MSEEGQYWRLWQESIEENTALREKYARLRKAAEAFMNTEQIPHGDPCEIAPESFEAAADLYERRLAALKAALAEEGE